MLSVGLHIWHPHNFGNFLLLPPLCLKNIYCLSANFGHFFTPFPHSVRTSYIEAPSASSAVAHYVSLRATITRIMSGNHRPSRCPQNTAVYGGPKRQAEIDSAPARWANLQGWQKWPSVAGKLCHLACSGGDCKLTNTYSHVVSYSSAMQICILHIWLETKWTAETRPSPHL